MYLPLSLLYSYACIFVRTSNVLFNLHTFCLVMPLYMPFSLRLTVSSSFSFFCFEGSILPDSFPDQFSPFRYFGCDFKNQYKGTLFRFPLRTASLARRSEISRKENTVQDMRRTLQDLVGQLAHHLIFLRHVKTIEIYSCAPGSTPTLIHSATSSTSKREYRNDQSLLNYFEKKNDLPREVFYEKVLSTPEDKLPTQNYKLEVIVNSYTTVTDVKPIDTGRVAQIVGEGDVRQNDEVEDERKVDGSTANGMEIIPANTVINENDTTTLVHTHTPTLSPSVPHISHQETVTYLIVSGLMGGEARRVACEERSRHLKLVPLGAVAACISRVGGQSHVRTYMDTSSNPKGMSCAKAGLAGAVGSCFPPTVGQAFCFLPLPVRTQLPVHVNAFWELSANRRDIWRYASSFLFYSHSSLLCLLSIDCDGRLHGVDSGQFLRLRLSHHSLLHYPAFHPPSIASISSFLSPSSFSLFLITLYRCLHVSFLSLSLSLSSSFSHLP
jgi:hypothetical protein